AWLGPRRLQVSKAASLGEALLSTGFPPDLRGQERTLEWWRYFSLHTRSLRRTGSTALNLAYVAAGRFDGYWAFDNHAWDVAGGMVLVREAGGQIPNVDGTLYDPYTPDALAAGPALYPVLLEAFRAGPGRSPFPARNVPHLAPAGRPSRSMLRVPLLFPVMRCRLSGAKASMAPPGRSISRDLFSCSLPGPRSNR